MKEETLKARKLAILTDLHGCYYTFLRLMKKLSKDHEIVLLGDLVDRGPNSDKVIKFAMANNLKVCKGNHELLMLCTHGYSRYHTEEVWAYSGGLDTLNSYNHKVPKEVLEWINKLPPRFEFDDGLLLSHTGWGTPLHEEWSLWERSMTFPNDGKFRCFGHSVQKEPLITDTFACIDTGAAYDGYRKLTAMLWPSKEIIQQDYNESPLDTEAKDIGCLDFN